MVELEAREEATGVPALQVLFVLCFCDLSPAGPLSSHLPITLCHLQSSQMLLTSRHHPVTHSLWESCLPALIPACTWLTLSLMSSHQSLLAGSEERRGRAPPGRLHWCWVTDGCCQVGSVGRDNRLAELQAGLGLSPAVAPGESADLPHLWVESLPLKLPWQGQSKCDRVTEDVHGGGGLTSVSTEALGAGLRGPRADAKVQGLSSSSVR